MRHSELTILVLNLPATVTVSELNIFFSYCGFVEKIDLLKNKDQSQSALVTFRQPYAFRTALLLNDCVMAGKQIRILSAKDMNHETNIIALAAVQGGARRDVPSEEYGMQKMVIDVREGNCKLAETGKVAVDRTKLGVAERMGTSIKNSEYVTTGVAWLSVVRDKTSEYISNLGTRKKDDPYSRKQK
ncbi:hypothetical protein K2173_006920 [Erythroxylum novogranatense]|uniref:RRM domain-containing protein n=1 Tax=Erythroxylum novogranatense TaxID=1862640 RepID=A0AAV8SY43_9ROSI|nr:hypothetical protein K2173_006920 [Erythroxylum novogranatense]